MNKSTKLYLLIVELVIFAFFVRLLMVGDYFFWWEDYVIAIPVMFFYLVSVFFSDIYIHFYRLITKDSKFWARNAFILWVAVNTIIALTVYYGVNSFEASNITRVFVLLFLYFSIFNIFAHIIKYFIPKKYSDYIYLWFMFLFVILFYLSSYAVQGEVKDKVCLKRDERVISYFTDKYLYMSDWRFVSLNEVRDVLGEEYCGEE